MGIMENPPRLSPLDPDLAPETQATRGSLEIQRAESGIWALEGDRLVNIEEFVEGPAVVLVRTEHVLVMSVELPPLTSMARRRAALPFAIEDRIAEPLDAVHVALGVELLPNTFLVGVVRHDLMREWVMRLADAGLERGALVPDALTLPVPGPGCWSVDLAAERALVRAADGTAFALPLSLLAAAWSAAGEPACIAYGDPLPPQMAAAQTELEIEPLAQRMLVPAIDLRQGPYAAPRRPINPLWKRIAMVAAAGSLAHATIAVADTLALERIADQREAEVRALAMSVQPGLVLGADLGSVVTDISPDGAVAEPGMFVPLLVRTGGALAGLQTPVAWRSVAFDAQAGALTISIEASDIGGLQRAAKALNEAGLVAEPGAASSDQGRAIGSFVVRAQ
jgi:general secretion pathway protein L